MTAAIETHKLTKQYGKSRGIIDVDLKVEQGDFFGFMGPNGAGKSTLIRTLLGLVKPSSGSAEILGTKIDTSSVETLSHIGYLPSEASFYPVMKVGEVLELSANLRGIDCAERRSSLCERLSLDRGKRISELSFGNKKKVAIVAALQHSPSLLLLDEPTSGLDPLMQHEFFTILKELHSEGTTIFLSSHILSEVQNNCINAAIIREGRIVACESVEKLSRTRSRRVVVRGRVDLSSLEGIKDLSINQDCISFLYNAPIKPLLERLSGSEIRDLNISEPSLEEIFMHYYI